MGRIRSRGFCGDMMEQSTKRHFEIRQIPGHLAVVRLGPEVVVPSWAWTGSLSAVVRTSDELTIVCDEAAVPEEMKVERGWIALMLKGPLPFSMTGVLSSLLEPLAAHQISVFVLSTFDTDCILVKAEQAERAKHVLQVEGHSIQ
jgi:uncharacterized protein